MLHATVSRERECSRFERGFVLEIVGEDSNHVVKNMDAWRGFQ